MLANFFVISRSAAEGRRSASDEIDDQQLTLHCASDAQVLFQEDRENVADLVHEK